MVRNRLRSLSPTMWIFGGAFALILLIGAAVVLVTAGQDLPPGERVRAFEARVVLDRGGAMHVSETITYDFAAGTTSHGISRRVPLTVVHDSTHERVYRLTNARAHSTSGAPDALSVVDGPVSTLRVGDAGSTVTGVQTYVLDYDLTGVVTAVDGGQRVDWNGTGDSWTVPIEKASVTISGPAAVLRAGCQEGSSDAPRTCSPALAGGAVTDTAATVLLPGQGLRVTADFAAGTFPDVPPVLVARPASGQGFALTPLTVGGALALFVALAGWPIRRAVAAWRRRHPGASRPAGAGLPTSDPARSDPARPAPPPEVGVGELSVLTDPDRAGQAVAATLLDLAGRGFVRVEEVGPTAEDGGSPADWRLIRRDRGSSRLRPFERQVFGTVFASGSAVELRGLGPRLFAFQPPTSALDGIGTGGRHPSTARLLWSVLAGVFGVLGLVGTILLAALTSWGLLGLGALLAAPAVLVAEWLTARWTASASGSAAGEALPARIGAFRKYLQRADADRIRSQETQDEFVGYLPYAVAFGSTDRWASVLTELTASGVRVSPPQWYAPDQAAAGGFDLERFADAVTWLVDEVVYLVENGVSTTEDAADAAQEGDEDAGSTGRDQAGDGPGSSIRRDLLQRDSSSAAERERAWLADPQRSAFGPDGPSWGRYGSSGSPGGSGDSGSTGQGAGERDSGGSGSW